MITFVIFIVILGILIFVHEFGHFISAKKFHFSRNNYPITILQFDRFIPHKTKNKPNPGVAGCGELRDETGGAISEISGLRNQCSLIR